MQTSLSRPWAYLISSTHSTHRHNHLHLETNRNFNTNKTTVYHRQIILHSLWQMTTQMKEIWQTNLKLTLRKEMKKAKKHLLPTMKIMEGTSYQTFCLMKLRDLKDLILRKQAITKLLLWAKCSLWPKKSQRREASLTQYSITSTTSRNSFASFARRW